MLFRFRNLGIAMVELYQSMLAHRQPPAPKHIGAYGGSFVDVQRNDQL
jgi:hypothetical protein